MILSPAPIDLNSDLGEGEPAVHTAALMAGIDSANIACGGHAGSVDTMSRCLDLAAHHGVHAGAHPGVPGTGGFGRVAGARLSPGDLRALLHDQVGPLMALAAARLPGRELHHIKLHGALYHATDADPDLADAYLDEVARSWPGLRFYARAGGTVAREAEARGLPVWGEAFLDRGYAADGTLVPRNRPGALLTTVEEVRARLADLREREGCRAIDGRWIPLRARTFCLHGDTPRALDFLAAIRPGRCATAGRVPPPAAVRGAG